MSVFKKEKVEKVEKISREVIEYLLKHPMTLKEKITNIKGRIGKK